MTRMTNARIAGFTFLFYIAVAFPSMVLLQKATLGVGMPAKLASLAQHATDVRVAVVLSVFGSFCALVLAVTLWAITREQDPDVAMLGLSCRVAEGVIGAASIPATLALLNLVTATAANAPDAAAAQAIGAFVLDQGPVVAALFFAVGSTAFAYLLLRGGIIPLWLAWVGVVGSALLVVGLPLQLGGVLSGLAAQLIWIPVAVFELTLGPWLLIKGVR